ncbi:hypothetical protein ACXYMU_14780 [Pontibacter sp. CAU 1760]
MKAIFLALVPLLLIFLECQAQDTITKKNGEKLQTKVLEITPAQVKYKRFENPDGPLYIINKSDVLLIQYEDKSEETFEPAAFASPTPEVEATAPGINYFVKGQEDAKIYYEGYKAASTGVLVVSLLSPAVGLIPAIATSTTPPKDKHLDTPNHVLMQQPDYKSGYLQRARKVKANKVWTNWGVALGINVALVYMLMQ